MEVILGTTWFEFDFMLLKEQIDSIENLLEKEVAETRRMVEEHAKKITDIEEKQEYCESYGDDIWKLEDRFPQMQREGNLIGIISFMEIQLNKFCDQAAIKNGAQIQVRDLYGGGIERARNYLSKVMDIKTPWATVHWQEVKYAADIRNDIIHNEGIIKKVETKNYIQKSNHLQLDVTSGRVVIKKTYISYILQEVRQVFEVIFKEWKEKQSQ